MNQIRYSAQQLQLLSSVVGCRCRSAVYDGACSVVFELEQFLLRASSESVTAATQNVGDEAITVRFEATRDIAMPSHSFPVASSCYIERIYIAQTILSFTDFERFETPDDALRGIPDDRTETTLALREILASSTGGYSEIVVNPNRFNWSVHDGRPANFVDVGALFQLGGRFVRCFPLDNSFLWGSDLEVRELTDVEATHRLVDLASMDWQSRRE